MNKKDDILKKNQKFLCTKILKKTDYEYCEKDIEVIINYIEKIYSNPLYSQEYKIKFSEYKLFKQSINDHKKNIMDTKSKYFDFVSIIEKTLTNDNYYFINDNGDRKPKSFFRNYIINYMYVIIQNIFKLRELNDTDFITLLKEYEKVYSDSKFLEENFINWKTQRERLDKLCMDIIDSRCNKNLELNDIVENINSLMNEFSDKNLSEKQKEVKPIIILQKYVETFEKIYKHPFFYQIASLDINDFVSCFTKDYNSKFLINLNYINENNKISAYEPSVLFNILFSFIYVDFTELYNLLYNSSDSNNINILKLKEVLGDNFVKKVTDDTSKAKKILTKAKKVLEYPEESIDNRYFLFIKTFYESVNIVSDKDIIPYENIHYIFVYLINKMKKSIKNSIELYKNLENENLKKLHETVYKKLENLLIENSSNLILTFLKINNFDCGYDKNCQDYNKRLNCRIIDDNKLELKYNDDNVIYYKKYNDKIKLNIDSKPILEKLYQNIDFDTSNRQLSIRENTYKNLYKLGPFSKIFPFFKNNKQISNELNENIIETLKKGKPIFILGYGASGAGKTSSLIYNNNSGENGIIINLCNKMAENGYNKLDMSSCEFFALPYINQDKGNKPKNTIRYIPPKENNNANKITFIFNDGEYRLADNNGYKHQNVHINNNDEKVFTFDKTNVKLFSNNNKIKDTDKLSEILTYIIDKDRLVFPTTNNPNSSRSHSLSFITFKKENEKDVNLIIGDFAGVENRFNCNDTNVINKFKQIKKGDKNYYDIVKDNFAQDNANEIFPEIDSTVFVLPKEEIENKKIELYNLFDKKINYKDISLEKITNDKIKNLEKFANDRIKNVYDTWKAKYNGKDTDKLLQIFKNVIKNLNFTPESAKYNIEKFFNEYYIKDLENEYTQNLKENSQQNSEKREMKYYENICKIRRNEGDMINSSLSDVRKVIKFILIYKNKDKINISPSFIRECIDFYCSEKKCFQLESENDKDYIKNLPEFSIFKEIYDRIGEKGLLELVVSIFCVLNISKSSNNPPPIPYIEINELKKLFYSSPKNDFSKFIKEFKIFLEKKDGGNFKNPPLSYFDVKNKDGTFPQDFQENIFSKDAVNNFEILLKQEDFIDVEGFISNEKFSIDGKKYLNDDEILKIKKFFDLINNFNSSSAIGTLDFLDSIAKFNTVDSICRINPNL